MSHRRADHTTGLRYVLSVNPNVKVYVPADGGNGFGGPPLPKTFLRPDESLPTKMRYYAGTEPEDFRWGKLYDKGDFVLVNEMAESSVWNFLGANSFAEEGNAGAAGIDAGDQETEWIAAGRRVLARGNRSDSGSGKRGGSEDGDCLWGLHLVTAPTEEIDTLVETLKTKWKVQRIVPGHCTGEPAFARLKKAYGENYLYAGLGTTVELK